MHTFSIQTVQMKMTNVLNTKHTDSFIPIPFAVTEQSKLQHTSLLVYSLLRHEWGSHIQKCPHCSALSDTESGPLDWSAVLAVATHNQMLQKEELHQYYSAL